MQALVLDAESKTANVTTQPIPSPDPGDVLVKVHSLGLNPVDALYTLNPLGATGRIAGSDFSDTVIEAPLTSNLHPGQRVAGFLQGACSANARPGAFAEYLVSKADLVWTVPCGLPLELAAAMSLCALTVAQAIFLRLGLDAPFAVPLAVEGIASSSALNDEPAYFFIYGASTSVGMYAAQLVRHSTKASGRRIRLIGAASRPRWEMLQTPPYVYDALVDYRDIDWPAQVQRLTNGAGVAFAFDCISEGSIVRQTSSTLRPNGKIALVRSREGGAWDAEQIPEDVEPMYGAVWEGLGEEVQYQGFVVPASASARAFAAAFYAWLSGSETILANSLRLMPGGLERIVSDGFALLGTGSMNDRRNKRVEIWMRPISGEK